MINHVVYLFETCKDIYLRESTRINISPPNDMIPPTFVLHCDENFLPVKNKADDEPECDAPHRLWQPGGVRLHVVERPVEGGDHPPDLVAAVEEDAVHPRVEERLTLPPVLQVNQDIEEGEQSKRKAGCDEDEGDAPEVLVDGHPPALLARAAQQGTQASCDQRPSCPTSQPVSMSREHLND